MTQNDVWVLIEATAPPAVRAGLELLTPGRQLADAGKKRLAAAVIGPLAEQAAAQAAACGADQAYIVTGPAFSRYQTEPYYAAMVQMLEKYRPEVLLISATDNGRDLAPRLSGRFRTGLTADCTGIAMGADGRTVEWTRPALSGNLMAVIVCETRRPQMGTIRPGVFLPPPPRRAAAGALLREAVPFDPASLRVWLENRRETGDGPAFGTSRVVVSGGLGLRSRENFALVQRLAQALHGAAGASRAAVNAGWAPYARQIGQSGKTVRPAVYIACGISGAVQHLAGIAGADTVIAINSDPQAPIFRRADYGIVGDAPEVLRALLAALAQPAK
jgi:electron transfer flavoprotein alpha subunit